MQRVQRASLRLADQTAERLGVLWDQHEAGTITAGAFRAAAAAVVARANAQGVQLVDIGVTAELARQVRRLEAPLGLQAEPVQVDQRRIADALERVAGADGPDPRARVARFGRDEALLTVATSTERAMKARKVERWVRVPDTSPCPICVSLADGIARTTSVTMRRHRGCGCIQQPIFT